MLQLQQHQIHSPLSVEDIHARIEDRPWHWLALSPNQFFFRHAYITRLCLGSHSKDVFSYAASIWDISSSWKGNRYDHHQKPGMHSTLNILMGSLLGLDFHIWYPMEYIALDLCFLFIIAVTLAFESRNTIGNKPAQRHLSRWNTSTSVSLWEFCDESWYIDLLVSSSIFVSHTTSDICEQSARSACVLGSCSLVK